MRKTLTILALVAAEALRAGEPMSAEAFDAYTRGKTLFYGFQGEPYGVERYLPGRKVIWSFLDGACKKGAWYEDRGMICFVYEDNPAPQCWTFERGAGGLVARFENDPETTPLYEVSDPGEEMICYGPKIGV